MLSGISMPFAASSSGQLEVGMATNVDWDVCERTRLVRASGSMSIGAVLNAKSVIESLRCVVPCAAELVRQFLFEPTGEVTGLFYLRDSIDDCIPHLFFVLWKKVGCVVVTFSSTNIDCPNITISNPVSKRLLEKLPETGLPAQD